jgi:hypothetical protein
VVCKAAKHLLRLTKQQVYRCYEALLLSWVDLADDDGAFKQFRLLVKRGLYVHDWDGLGLQDMDVDVRKRKLEALFQDRFAQYCIALRRMDPSFRRRWDGNAIIDDAIAQYLARKALEREGDGEGGENEEDEEGDEEEEDASDTD